MADENISEELQSELEKVVKSFRGNATFVSDTMNGIVRKIANGERIRQSEFDAFTKELRDARYGVRNFVNDVISVGGAFTGVAGAMGQGTSSFEILKDTVDLATKAFGTVSEAAGALVGRAFGPIGATIGKKLGAAAGDIGRVAGEIAKYMIGIFDDVQKTFTSLSQIGGISAKGMEGMVDQFGKIQIPLQDFAKIIQQNSANLALLGGTVYNGVDQMAAAFNRMETDAQGSAQQLRNLGMQTAEINDTMISYADMQRRIGAQEYMDTEKLRVGTLAYGKELDMLSKITGKSREQAQAAMNEALLNERFNAKLRQMQINGQAEAAKELRLAVLTQSIQGNKQMASAIMSGATGFYTTPEARAMAASMPGFIDNVNQLVQGGQDVASFTQNLQNSAKVYEEQFRGLAMAIGPDSPVTKHYIEAVNVATANAGKMGEAIEAARKATEQGATAPTAQTQNLTKTVRDIEIATSAVQHVLMDDKVGFTKLMSYAAEGIKEFSTTVRDAVKNWGQIDKAANKSTLQADNELVQANKDVVSAAEKLVEVRSNENAAIADLEKAEREFLESRIRAKEKYEQNKISQGVASNDPSRVIGKFSKEEQKIAEKYNVNLPTTFGELTTAVNNLNTTMSKFSSLSPTPVQETPLQQVLDPKFTEKYNQEASEIELPEPKVQIPEAPEIELPEPKVQIPEAPEVELPELKVQVPEIEPAIQAPKTFPESTKTGPKLNSIDTDALKNNERAMQEIAEEQKKTANETSKTLETIAKHLDSQQQAKPMSEETGKKLLASIDALPEYMQTLIGETRKNGMYTRNA